MSWWSGRSQGGDGAGGAADAPSPAATAFSAPPSSDPAPSASPFSAPPPADAPPPSSSSASKSYDKMDFSKYASSVYESDGLSDARIAERERKRSTGSSLDGFLLQHPRARQCVYNIQLGAKMGASVGGCFGLLTGMWVAVTQRNLLVLPVSVIGGAISFGFFLGCGMIIRCEDGAYQRVGGGCMALPPPPPAPSAVEALASTAGLRQRGPPQPRLGSGGAAGAGEAE